MTGATGKQGALVNELAGGPFTLRAMTRRPDGEVARTLRARGVDVVPSDLDDEPSLPGTLEGA